VTFVTRFRTPYRILRQSPKTTGLTSNKDATLIIDFLGLSVTGSCPVVWQKNEVCTCAAGMVKT
ncbi:hypothetical protein, partial [Escherichia coli]|uniref:hypothetical protein n=1 Tax=Escherichia coli TaxID=562 RepID=UPI0022EBDA5D